MRGTQGTVPLCEAKGKGLLNNNGSTQVSILEIRTTDKLTMWSVNEKHG